MRSACCVCACGQADCPEDAATYIHRVGRTARYMAAGRALMLLTPSEKGGMLDALEEAKVPVKSLKVNPDKQQPVTPALQALLSKDITLKVRHGVPAVHACMRAPPAP